jgi:hypothetical protein
MYTNPHESPAPARRTLARLRRLDRILRQWDEPDLATMSETEALGIALLCQMRQALVEQLDAHLTRKE